MRAGPLTLAVPCLAAGIVLAILAQTPPRPVPPAPSPAVPLVAAAAGDVDAALARDLFGSAAAAPADPPADPEAELPADDAPPTVIGIVGRLGRDAVALVRRAGGGTRMLAIGETAGGWQLDSIAADAVLFTREGRRVRVELPAG